MFQKGSLYIWDVLNVFIYNYQKRSITIYVRCFKFSAFNMRDCCTELVWHEGWHCVTVAGGNGKNCQNKIWKATILYYHWCIIYSDCIYSQYHLFLFNLFYMEHFWLPRLISELLLILPADGVKAHSLRREQYYICCAGTDSYPRFPSQRVLSCKYDNDKCNSLRFLLFLRKV